MQHGIFKDNLNQAKNITQFLKLLKIVNADILILTETNQEIELGYEYSSFLTSKPTESFYKEGETSVAIFSKYLAVGQIETFRSDTSICSILKTPLGELAIYGTIIVNCGIRLLSFKEDLEKQISPLLVTSSQNELPNLSTSLGVVSDLPIS